MPTDMKNGIGCGPFTEPTVSFVECERAFHPSKSCASTPSWQDTDRLNPQHRSAEFLAFITVIEGALPTDVAIRLFMDNFAVH